MLKYLHKPDFCSIFTIARVDVGSMKKGENMKGIIT